MREGETATHISMFSNSSRFLCLLRKAAARFLTRRASRLLRPETSGGIKSLVLMRSPAGRGFLAPRVRSGVDDGRLWGFWGDMVRVGVDCGDEGVVEVGERESGKSKSWWVGRQSWGCIGLSEWLKGKRWSSQERRWDMFGAGEGKEEMDSF